jgi:8-oxo-dGTP diphosphatase
MNLSIEDYMATLTRKRMGAGVLFTNAAGLVLLVEPTYKDEWEIPGGSVEADESPFTAAAREVHEELGLVVTPGRLLVADWVAAREGRTEAVGFIYAGEVLDLAREAEIQLPADELRSWAWCNPAQAETLLSKFLARRVSAALQALQDDTMLYLENGSPVG